MPSARIVATTLRAAEMLDPGRGDVLGKSFHTFTTEPTQGGQDLIAGIRLNGIEAFRVLRRSTGPNLHVRMWLRNFDHQSPSNYVLAIIVADRPKVKVSDRKSWREAPAVVGTANSALVIERISLDAETLFSLDITTITGMSLFSLVVPDDATRCLAAVTDASTEGRGVTVNLRVRTGGHNDGGSLNCETLILPLEPSPSCVFIFLPSSVGAFDGETSNDLSDILVRLGRGAELAKLAHGILGGLTDHDVPGLARLTARELEIVAMLLDGDRPPIIATNLYLTQSTVRNHLAAVFSKLGVTSQQGLLDLFRTNRASPAP
ncbi:MAG: helix-turn-helix transcriptional regulator [Jatrophihabitantaceae bacterium]